MPIYTYEIIGKGGRVDGTFEVLQPVSAPPLTEDPDTAVVLCDNVKGLGLTLDPSHYICGPHFHRSIDKLMKYVYHVHLRDSAKDQLQVRIGQGEVEYGRLVNQLNTVGYNRALSVHVTEMEGTDHMGEMRKMRLLLESLL